MYLSTRVHRQKIECSCLQHFRETDDEAVGWLENIIIIIIIIIFFNELLTKRSSEHIKYKYKIE